MTPLRKRVVEDMQLAGLAAKTQELYLQAVSRLARRCRKSPDLLTEEEVRRYLLDEGAREAAPSHHNHTQAGSDLEYGHQTDRQRPEQPL